MAQDLSPPLTRADPAPAALTSAASLSLDPDILLTRRDAAAALKVAGYPVAPATLATRATRGGGPRYRKFGARPLYRWGDLLDWANSRLGPPVRSTAEADSIATSRAVRNARRS
jgi:hypothetical protein